MIGFDELLLALNELENIVVVTDINGNVRYVNDTFEDKYGYTRAEVLGKSTSILNANYHKAPFYKEMWASLLSGETWEGIFLNKSKDGRLIWEQAKISPIKKDNVIDGFIAIKEDITYKKQKEEEFRKEKFLLDELFENTPFGIILFEAQNDKKYFEALSVVKSNPQANHILQKHNIVGSSLDVFLPEFKASKNHDNNIFLYRNTTETFFPSISRHLKIITFPLDKDGFCMFIHDVTDYKKSIQLKEESEHRYAKLVEDAPALIRRFDSNGLLSYVNSSYSNHLNRDVSHLLRSNLFQYLSRDEKLLFQNRISALNTHNPIAEYEQSLSRVDGNTQWIKWIDRALFDASGNVVEYQSVGMDFTDFKKTKLQLEEQKNRLDAIFDNSLMGICVIDTEGKLKASNRRLADMLGFESIDDFVGTNYFDYIPSTDIYEEIQENFAKVFADITYSFNVHRQYAGIDGRKFWGDIYISPITIVDGRITEAVGLIVDITKRKKVEEELKANEEKLRQLNITKDKLFSVIAHDIRNPFNAILGFSSILEQNINTLNRDEVQEYAHKISDASEQTFKLLEDLLTWAKSQLGQLKVYKERFKPSDVIQETVQALSVLSSSKLISITLECPTDLSLICDMTMFKFVVRNLLHNAIKFSHKGGKVICSVNYVGDEVLVSVRDFGVGIKSKKLKTLFDINELVSSKGTAEEKGTGLGLSMAKEMIELNNGSISVTSEYKKGSEFKVVFPLGT